MAIDVNPLFQWVAAGGLVAAIGAGLKAYRSLRSGASARQKEFVEEQVQRRKTAEKELAAEKRESSYWQDVAARYRWQLMSRNIDPDPLHPKPPSEQEGGGSDESRRQKPRAIHEKRAT